MRTFTLAAVLIALLMAPAYAQRKTPSKEPSPEQIEEKRKAEQLDKAYNDAMKNTRTAPPTYQDPWQNVRPSAPAPAKR